MRHWWVNQNQTYRYEVPGGFLWSPKTTSNGRRNYYYDAMEQVSPGDLVFSFCDTLIKAIGVVQRPALTAPKPLTPASVRQAACANLLVCCWMCAWPA